jgi:heme exporter protein C
VVGIVAAVDIPIVHFSVEWWRGLHQTATFGSPDKILNPAAPSQFVIALVAMVGAVTLAWAWLMMRRYQLARIEWQIEEHGRLGRISAARRAATARAAAAPAGNAEEGAT